MKKSSRAPTAYPDLLRIVEELPSPQKMATELTKGYGSQVKVAHLSGIAQNTFHRIFNGSRTNLKVHIYLLLLKAFLRFKCGQKVQGE